VDATARQLPAEGAAVAPPGQAFVQSALAALRAVRDSAGPGAAQANASVQAAAVREPVAAAMPPAPAPATAPAPAPAPATEAPAIPAAAIPADTTGGATVRIATAKLDALLFRAEELRIASLHAAAHAADLRALMSDAGPLQARLAALCADAQRNQRQLAGAADGLLDDVKEMLVLPASSVVELLAKTVRDLSREQGKTVHLAVTGSGIEIDRRILQEIRDPLLHLVRNAVDHGIEPPAVRASAGKPQAGQITIAFERRGGNRIDLMLSDDGAGIDTRDVHDAASRAGLDDAALARDALELVFHSGVSTAETVSELSGRGLGLAIVREKVEKLGGAVTVESQPGHGTSFRLALPVSLATFRAVHVKTAGRQFFLPTTHVEQAIRVQAEDVRHVENRDAVAVRGELVPLVDLAQALELSRMHETDGQGTHAIVVFAGNQRVAFAVDDVLGEQEVMAKPLGPQLARVRNVAGATVMGDGEAVPLLHIPDLMRSAASAGARASPTDAAPLAQAELEAKSVLVAEDSITSRTLLQNILELAGYRVTTAVDGVDAFTQLRTAHYDVVVSDVEMPRMNGFELTERIRADANLARIPVVLVTALGSPRDRERGVDAGADAYIVKSSFDQDHLLKVLERLV
jgi:two-component system chemotaxis sensor kinase CheA